MALLALQPPATWAAPSAADVAHWAERAQVLAEQAAQTAWKSHSAAQHVAASDVRIQAISGSLDARLQLAPCLELDVYLPAGHKAWGPTRVGLRCLQGRVRWNVTLPMQVQVMAPAWRTRSGLPTGTLLSAEHLERAPTDWGSADSPPFALREALIGRSLLRSLPASHTLRDVDLKRRQWFAAGDTVRVVAAGPGYQVAAEGVALSPGIEGQSARVRTEAGRVVTGTATGERRVELSL